MIMALNWTPITGDFNDTLYNNLLKLEAPLASERLSGKIVSGNFTIGIGFDLIKGAKPVQKAVFAALGVTASFVGQSSAPAVGTPQRKEYDFVQELLVALAAHKGSPDLDAIMARRVAAAQADPSYLTYLGAPPRSTFSFANDSEVRQVFDSLWISTYRVVIFNRLPELRADAAFASSREIVALASMTWNGGGGILGSKLRAKVEAGNRAEAWFEVRYGSNGGASESPGLAKRRYVESQLFGAYSDPASVTTDESQKVFAMLAKHRTEILSYEAKYGVPPDGTTATRNMIKEANDDPNLSSIVVVQSLVLALTPARDAFITWVNTQLPSGETPLVAAAWNPAAIAYNSPTLPMPILDARSLDGKANGMEKNLLVGNDTPDHLIGGKGADVLVGGKGVDFLRGGAGDDTMYGGEAEDTYVIDLRDGPQHDRIVDSDNKGRIIVIGADGNALNTIILHKQDTPNTWTDKDGKVTISHNGPWKLTLSDGSVIELGDNFDPLGFGISLQDKPAVTTTTYTGDFKKAVDANGWFKYFNFNYVRDGSLLEANAQDIITGSLLADKMQGLGGNDALFGAAGDDVIEGGDGDDLLLGGLGADTLYGSAGKDYIVGAGPTAQGPEYTCGFSWLTYNSGTGPNQVGTYTVHGANVLSVADDAGNVIAEAVTERRLTKFAIRQSTANEDAASVSVDVRRVA